MVCSALEQQETMSDKHAVSEVPKVETVSVPECETCPSPAVHISSEYNPLCDECWGKSIAKLVVRKCSICDEEAKCAHLVNHVYLCLKCVETAGWVFNSTEYGQGLRCPTCKSICEETDHHHEPREPDTSVFTKCECHMECVLPW